MISSVELFAGAGGLALGFSEHGVSHRAVVEWNRHACDTIRNNKAMGVAPVSHWPDVFEGDVRNFDYSKLHGLDLVTGGPPCQPFSMGGKHGGSLDERDMFPQAVRAVREIRPRAFVFENVRGLTRAAFNEYFEYIKLQLAFPTEEKWMSEDWTNHRDRLLQTARPTTDRTYRVQATLVNAANYGVPQKRMRVFIVGFREDTNSAWMFPSATHSYDSLLVSQWGTGEYWERHKVSRKARPPRPDGIESKVKRLMESKSHLTTLPWRTVRDAIADLPDPERFQGREAIQAHKFQPGARTYPGHTGSPLDEPAKALKAGDHGVPGGENMLRRLDGSVRYFTVRESARIQTFPDDFLFDGTWGETMRQLGNAVPVKLASVVAQSVCEALVSNLEFKLLTGT